ncbi:MAG: hypothetical protein Fur005_12650 [Roseiflexaceae bacterium]
MGLTSATTPEQTIPLTPIAPLKSAVALPQRGLQAWLAGLPPRERFVYLIMVGILATTVALYFAVGVASLTGMPNLPSLDGFNATAQPSATVQPSATTQPSATAQPSATPPPATPTALPTNTPSPQPTTEPTREPIFFPPTSTPAPPTVLPTTAVPATSAPTQVPQATQAPKPTQVPQPTQAPVVEVSNEVLWLYFGDSSGTLFVPVQRQVRVENKQVARAAVQALIDGPRNGLSALLARDAKLIEVKINNGTALVNFDREPSADARGADALTLTLTHFSSIQRVQILVNGKATGPARARPVVNPINPLGLPTDPQQTEFLPLYFLSNDGYHHIRVIRMVPKTKHTAEGTVRALLEGPGGYGYALQQVIPAGTELRGISISDGVVSVDFTEQFANAGDRATAVRTITESLTTLPGVRGVRFLIEGSSAADWWGEEYGRVFERTLINAE